MDTFSPWMLFVPGLPWSLASTLEGVLNGWARPARPFNDWPAYFALASAHLLIRTATGCYRSALAAGAALLGVWQNRVFYRCR